MKTQITVTLAAVALYALIAPMLILSVLIVLACLAWPVLMVAVYIDNKTETEQFSLNASQITFEAVKAQNEWDYNNYLDCVALCYTIEQKAVKPKAKRKSRAKAKTLTIIQELTALDNNFKFAFTI